MNNFMSIKIMFMTLALLLLNIGSIKAQEVTTSTPAPSFQLAQPMTPDASTIPSAATVTPVRVGDRARISGVLYSLEANAWLLSEFERVQSYWILEMNSRVNLTLTWARHELALQQNRNVASLAIMQVQLDAANGQAESLADVNRELMTQVGWTRREKFRFVISVIGVGAIAAVGGYFVGSALSR